MHTSITELILLTTLHNTSKIYCNIFMEDDGSVSKFYFLKVLDILKSCITWSSSFSSWKSYTEYMYDQDICTHVNNDSISREINHFTRSTIERYVYVIDYLRLSVSVHNDIVYDSQNLPTSVLPKNVNIVKYMEFSYKSWTYRLSMIWFGKTYADVECNIVQKVEPRYEICIICDPNLYKPHRPTANYITHDLTLKVLDFIFIQKNEKDEKDEKHEKHEKHEYTIHRIL